jgi:hypothetical protein
MDRVAQLIAESDISRIIHLYCHAIDRRRWDLMEHVFHEDARYGFGDIGPNWREFLRAARAIVDPQGPSHHMVANILIEFDGNTAHVETYLNSYHVIPAGYSSGDATTNGLFRANPAERYVSIVGGRYIDRFELRGPGWRIARRTGVYDWIQDLPYTDGGLSQSPAHARGTWNDSDPSYPVTARLRRKPA